MRFLPLYPSQNTIKCSKHYVTIVARSNLSFGSSNKHLEFKNNDVQVQNTNFLVCKLEVQMLIFFIKNIHTNRHVCIHICI